MRLRKYRGAWLPVVVLLLALAACGSGEEEAPVLQAVERPPTQTPGPPGDTNADAPFAGLDAPPVGAMDLPAAEGVSGRIVFARGEKLYAGRFDGAAMKLVADDVTTNYFLPAPDGSRVVYSALNLQDVGSAGFSVRSFAPTVVHLDTLEKQSFAAPEGYLRTPMLLPGWLPDGRALAWDRARGANLIDPAAGTIAYLGGQARLAWLADSSLLLVDDAEPDTRIVDEPALYRVDPESGERVALEIAFSYPLRDFLALEDDLAALGYRLADNFHDYHRTDLLPDGARVFIEQPANAGMRAMPYCQRWRVLMRPRDAASGTEPEAIYSDPETTFITDLTALPDGSVLFLRWVLEGCEFMGEMRVELIQVVPGEAPVVLTGAINPGLNGNANDVTRLLYESRRKYDVSPDGRYVIWIGGGLQAGSSSLNVIDLDTGDTAPVLAQPVSVSGANHIETVFWLPD